MPAFIDVTRCYLYAEQMRVTYDPQSDAAYVYLTEESLMPGRDSIRVTPPRGMEATVVMDWREGKIVGLEILDASALLHADLLAFADRPALQQDGAITIVYKRLPERDQEEGREFVWEYRPDPPISDELAARLLREVADRL